MNPRLFVASHTGLEYWQNVRNRAKQLGSDGCSGPTLKGFYSLACFEHDIHYRTHHTLSGNPITRSQADQIFRLRHQEMSPLGGITPMGWWRWVALRVFGGSSWRDSDAGNFF